MPLPARALRYWSCFEASGKKWQIDPYVLAAICERETECGESSALDKKGPEGRGDHGHGHGLMQIDDRWHGMWLRTHDWRVPAANIDKACEVLCAPRLALKDYLPALICAYNAGPTPARRVMARCQDLTEAQKVHELDLLTTHKNYVSDVLSKVAKFKVEK